MISAFLTISMAGIFSASASPIELEQSTLLLIPSAIMMLLLPYLLFVIFKLKRSRQQLRISEHRLKSTVEGSGDTLSWGPRPSMLIRLMVLLNLVLIGCKAL